jgi:transcription antitermination factor NusG
MLTDNTKLLEDYRPGSAGWFALHTRHQHEHLVERSLTYKGFEVFLPQYTSVRQWSDRTKVLPAPLFPCYLFLRGGLEQRLSVLTTPGVHGFVEFAGMPAIVPDVEIEAVRRTLARGAHVEPHPFLKCGDWVRVKHGPLEGIEGILVRHKSQFRLVLSVEIVQKSAAVEVDAWMVERACKPERRESGPSFSFNPRPCTRGLRGFAG